MRSLFWKIFISFWLASILVIITIGWLSSHVALQSSIPDREQVFMDSYANAAVATYESGQQKALMNWLRQIGISRHMTVYLLTSNGDIIGTKMPPESVKKISENLLKDQLNVGLFKMGDLIVSHEILSTSGMFYRLVAVTDKPFSHLGKIPWAGLTIRLFFAVLVSGFICYLLSSYLTKPLRSLRNAAKSIARGQLSTRVSAFKGHGKDEISELSHDFNRMAEQVETLVTTKERLLQDISHELRSPLARLQIALELGKSKTNNLAVNEFSRMELECKRLNDLIAEILDCARLDTSTLPVDKEKTNLADLINEVVHDTNYEFGQANPRVEAIDIKPCTLVIDPRLIKRAIENIVRNALHYSPENQKVTISTYINKQSDSISIDILDRGPGVPNEQLDMIFQPFYRVDTSREKKTGGYGLGLAIASSAIAIHNGTIIAQNAEKSGLLIRITLPLI